MNEDEYKDLNDEFFDVNGWLDGKANFIFNEIDEDTNDN